MCAWKSPRQQQVAHSEPDTAEAEANSGAKSRRCTEQTKRQCPLPGGIVANPSNTALPELCPTSIPGEPEDGYAAGRGDRQPLLSVHHEGDGRPDGSSVQLKAPERFAGLSVECV